MIERTDLFQLGDFLLHSGARSFFKLECDSLTDGDIACLARLVRELIGPFKSVEGVPRGGLRLAAALQQYAEREGSHVIADDVLTSGKSMEEARVAYQASHPNRASVGVVIFARGRCPLWVRAMFQIPSGLWIKTGEGK